MKWLDKLFNTNALGQLTAYDKQSVLIRNCLQKFVWFFILAKNSSLNDCFAINPPPPPANKLF